MATATSSLASTNPDWLAYMQAQQQNGLATSQGQYTPQAQALLAGGDPNATLGGGAPQAQTAQSVQAPGQPQQLPQLPVNPSANTGTPIGLSGVGNPISGTPAAADQFTQVGQGNQGNDLNDILQQAYNNQTEINNQGQELTQEGEAAANYYGNQQSTYDQAQAQALNALATTPGYTNAQASQINTDYSQFNSTPGQLNAEYLTPDQQAAAMGNTQAPVNTAYTGTANEGAQLNAYDANLGGQVNAYGADLSGELGNNSNYVGGATSALDTGLQNATSPGSFSSLNAAVNNPGLQFDPNNTESQITPAQMQQIETAAGTTIGNQFGAAEDTLRQNAAAAGNTSPLALAAANNRLQVSEASQAGQASTAADIAASNAQYSRAAAIEAQREGAVQTQTGLEAGAATTEQSQQQAAAGLAGTQGVSAAENVGAADIAGANAYGTQAINAANTYGNAALSEQNTMTGQQYAAENTAEQENAARALALAQNQQATTTNINQTEYNQGTGSAQLTSQGAQTVGNAAISGQNAYRSGVQAQQSQAQSGLQNATSTQQNAYGTETSGLNSSTATAGNVKTNQPSVIGDIGSVAKAIGAKAGEVISEPSVRLVGEAGPEAILPVGKPRYRSNQRMAA